MYQLLLNNPVFLAPLLLVVSFIVLDLISWLMAGAGITTAIDGAIDFGSEYVSWLNKSQIPSSIWWAIFLTCFSANGFLMLGLVLPDYSAQATGITTAVIAFLSFFNSLIVTRFAAIYVAKYLPDVETSAVGRKELIGLSCVVTSQKISWDTKGECKVVDLNGKTHYFMAKPKQPDTNFEKGESGIIRSYQDGIFIIEKREN